MFRITLLLSCFILSYSAIAQSTLRYSAFSSFTCQVQDGKHLISWQQNADIPIEHIAVQRSTDAIHFETILEISLAEFVSNQSIELPLTACRDYYYRLEAAVGAELFYSSIVFQGCETPNGDSAFELRRNISNQHILLTKNTLEESVNAQYAIYNLQGHLVEQEQLPSNFQYVEIDISQLPTGNYCLRVEQSNLASRPLRFIKVD